MIPFVNSEHFPDNHGIGSTNKSRDFKLQLSFWMQRFGGQSCLDDLVPSGLGSKEGGFVEKERHESVKSDSILAGPYSVHTG